MSTRHPKFRNLIFLLFALSIFADGYSQVNFTKHVIDNKIPSPFHLYVTDFNHNGKADIIVASQSGKIVLYLNNGSGSFNKRTVENHYGCIWNVFAIDLDRDGDEDILAAVSVENTIAWWRNDGGSFSRHIIGTNVEGAEAVRAADLDKDGDIDVVGAACLGGKVYWYENKGTQKFNQHLLVNNINTPYYLNIIDVDNDNDNDIILGSSSLYWWRNSGNGTFTRNNLDSGFHGCYSVESVYYNKDGYQDVVCASYSQNKVVVYVNNHGSFSKITVANNFTETHSAFGGDLDGDGDVDIAATSRDLNEVAYFENLGGGSFQKHSIDTNFKQAHGISIADFNRDGRLDIVATARMGKEVAWWENRSTPTENVSTPDVPAGQTTGFVDENLTFSTGGSVSSQGHTVEYQFDWGDGNFSGWGAATASHAYSDTGTFAVRARARCASHASKVSGWSGTHNVEIIGETIIAPNVPTGPDSGLTADTLNFSVSGASSSLGHVLEYQFSWGDGTVSSWGNSNRSHQFASAGSYQVKARARCQTHTSSISTWSGSKTVSIKPRYFQIGGKVAYYSKSEPISNVTINMTGDLNEQQTTNVDGSYSFTLIQGASVAMSASKGKGEDVGQTTINMYDAALAAQCALELISLSNYQEIAADVDKDGSILTFDAVLIAQHVVGLDGNLNLHVGEWDFKPDNLAINGVQRSQNNKNFTAIIIGDVSGNWSVTQQMKKALSDLVVLSERNERDELIINVGLRETMEAMSIDFDISFDGQDFNFSGIKGSGILSDFSGYQNVETDRFRIGFFSAKKMPIQGEIFSLHLRKNSAHRSTSMTINKFQINNIILVSQSEISLSNLAVIQNYQLEQNFPNPFNSQTVIKYKLPKSGKVSVSIYNIDGQLIMQLVNRFQDKGIYSVIWDGRDDSGTSVSGGVYLCKFRTNNFEQARKLILIK